MPNLYVPCVAGDEIRRVIVESLLPFLKRLFVSRKKKKANGDKMAEVLSDTALTEYDQFDDYLEMVIQFGVSMWYIYSESYSILPIDLVNALCSLACFHSMQHIE